MVKSDGMYSMRRANFVMGVLAWERSGCSRSLSRNTHTHTAHKYSIPLFKRENPAWRIHDSRAFSGQQRAHELRGRSRRAAWNREEPLRKTTHFDGPVDVLLEYVSSTVMIQLADPRGAPRVDSVHGVARLTVWEGQLRDEWDATAE